MSVLEKFFAGGYLPASFLDWDGHVAAVIFTLGCNFRCPWCHNSDLVLFRTEPIPLPKIIEAIKRRKNFLDGIVVSGGEPCIWEGLLPLLHELKTLMLPVKLDTNGSLPDVILQVLKEKLVDHVAMDVKAPLTPDALKKVTGVSVSVEAIRESIELIRHDAPSYEFRTTYIPQLLSQKELIAIRKELNDDKHWFVQCFRPANCLAQDYCALSPVDPEEVKKLLPGVHVRG